MICGSEQARDEVAADERRAVVVVADDGALCGQAATHLQEGGGDHVVGLEVALDEDEVGAGVAGVAVESLHRKVAAHDEEGGLVGVVGVEGVEAQVAVDHQYFYRVALQVRRGF
jgi:hypothetical protein